MIQKMPCCDANNAHSTNDSNEPNNSNDSNTANTTSNLNLQENNFEMVEYCALCSMAVKNKSIKSINYNYSHNSSAVFDESNSKQEIKYFCCNSCKQKFDDFYSNHK